MKAKQTHGLKSGKENSSPAAAVVARGRKPVPENETREDKLIRLAEARVNAACKRIKLIGNLAAYKPTAAQTEQIMQALGMACANVNNRLDGVKAESIVFSIHKS